MLVCPIVSAFTTPVAPIVATVGEEELHVPLVAVDESVVLLPATTLVAPVILPAIGVVFTVTIRLTLLVPHSLLKL